MAVGVPHAVFDLEGFAVRGRAAPAKVLGHGGRVLGVQNLAHQVGAQLLRAVEAVSQKLGHVPVRKRVPAFRQVVDVEQVWSGVQDAMNQAPAGVEFLLHPLALREIHMGADDAARLPLGIEQQGASRQNPAVASVLVPQPEVRFELGRDRVQGLKHRQCSLAVLGVDPLLPLLDGVAHLAGRVTKLRLPLWRVVDLVRSKIVVP